MIKDPIFFNDQDEFRSWLMKNHLSAKELWVGYHKKGTGKSSMTWSESVDQALCFGWIDGVRYKYDEYRYCIRFTPRKKTSRWSIININKVNELIRQRLVMPAGLEAFSHCREPNVAHYSFEAPAKELPGEYLIIFGESKNALDFFAKQPPSYKKMAVHYILSGKRKETQLKRLSELISASADNRRLFDR
jgi:uncharacterized protein YdeI (YjbR/CyaY-like superfamily)